MLIELWFKMVFFLYRIFVEDDGFFLNFLLKIVECNMIDCLIFAFLLVLTLFL